MGKGALIVSGIFTVGLVSGSIIDRAIRKKNGKPANEIQKIAPWAAAGSAIVTAGIGGKYFYKHIKGKKAKIGVTNII
jgi:hypothetical protein